MTTPVPIPATPGYTLRLVTTYDGSTETDEYPVIGWVWRGDAYIETIIIDEVGRPTTITTHVDRLGDLDGLKTTWEVIPPVMTAGQPPTHP